MIFVEQYLCEELQGTMKKKRFDYSKVTCVLRIQSNICELLLSYGISYKILV